MVHVELLVHAEREKHDEFYREVNQWEYEVEGEYRKGVCRPVVSELKAYDVRICNDAKEQFVTDVRAFTHDKFSTGNHKTQGLNFFTFFVRLFRRFSPFKTVTKKPTIKHSLSPQGWIYTHLIGCVDDPKQKINVDFAKEKYREIL